MRVVSSSCCTIAMGERPRQELLYGLASLYHSRDFSDLVVFGKDGSRHAVHRAVLCPRSEYIYTAVKEGKWRGGIEGHLALPEEDDEVVRLIVEYFYLLDYDPIIRTSSEDITPPTDISRSSSDALSFRTDAGTYGHVYGSSAISAFGGPESIFSSSNAASAPFRARTDSALTMHAIPGGPPTDFHTFSNNPQPRRRKTMSRGMVMSAPEPSPLATKEAHLILHARMYAAAEKYGIGGLKALALDKFKIQLTRHWDAVEFAEAIHVVYSSTPPSDKDMREVVADTLGWHGRLLEKPEIEVAILDINGLAYELLKRSRRIEPEYME